MALRHVRRLFPLVAVLACCLTVGAADQKRRTFGPEWKKIDPKSELGKFGVEYERTATATFRHSYGNTAGFELPLECGDTVSGFEIDDNAGVNVRVSAPDANPYGSFEVAKGSKGKAESFIVVVGPNVYYDLDGDGMFDGMYDNRSAPARKPMILFGGKFIPVEDNKAVFRAPRGETLKVWGVGRTEQYEFTNGQWRLVK